MEIAQALQERRSIRGFTPKPVPIDVLTELLRNATRAPSGVNSQPWEFFVIQGEPLEELKRAGVEQYRLGVKPHPDVTIPRVGNVAPKLQGVYKEREVRVAKQIFGVLGIVKGDTQKLKEYHENMYSFFGAPAVIVLVFDNMLSGGWPLVDMGIMTQTIALSALDYGLGTCIMRAIVDYPDKLRPIAGIPDSKNVIVGIAIGYPEEDNPLNHLHSEREELSNILTVVG